jgi:hypothetical protein
MHEVQLFATDGGLPIADADCMDMTLTALEKSGVLTTGIERWRETDESAWTIAAFRDHFAKANKERLRKLTAQQAGYHGAHAATAPAPSPSATAAAPNPYRAIVDGTDHFYYCWSHGLGTNPTHTSLGCRFKKPGHVDTATGMNRQGGNSGFMEARTGGTNRRPRPASTTTSPPPPSS